VDYVIWTLPVIIVVAMMVSGKAGTLAASILGTVVAVLVALFDAPVVFTLRDACIAIARGTWIGWVIVPYILGGLLFWQIAIRPSRAAMPVETYIEDARARRRLLFTACFLIGPFAESATRFGVGIIGTMVLVRRLNVQPIYLLTFALLSQTMILWGGMGSGAIIGAAFARTDPTTLAVNSSFYVAVFNAFYLPLYWRLARNAGISASCAECASEALWLGAAIALVIAATAFLGPEIAMLAAYGPVIVVRYLADERPNRVELRRAMTRMLPFVVLIGSLVFTRLVPTLQNWLEQTIRFTPFEGAPTWSPLFHAGTWLVAGALVTGLVRGDLNALPCEVRSAWKTGKLAVATIITFSMMAEVLSLSGIAGGVAQGLFDSLGKWAILLTPAISGIFGAIANSGNAANGLFMASQTTLAIKASLSVASVIALQHVSALSLNMVSPVRMSIVCNLAGTPEHERKAYLAMMPFVASTMAVLFASAILIAMQVM